MKTSMFKALSNRLTSSSFHVRPHVLMVSTYPPDTDGIAFYTARLEGALRKEGITIKVAASGREWKKDTPSYILSIMRESITSGANVVHVQFSYFMFGHEFFTGLFPLLAAGLKLLGKKIVITLHDVVPRLNVTTDFLKRFTYPRFLKFKRAAFICFTKLICLMVDKVVVHSEVARRVLIQDYGVPKRKLIVIPHGIDQKPSPPIKINGKMLFHINKSRPIVSYFGLIRHGKGLEDLVKAWRRVLEKVDAEMLIIGGRHPYLKDNCYENLVKLIRKLRLERSIHFCGYVPNDKLPAYFTKSDAFIFPYNEWGDVIASSGALSVVAPYLKPIIATDVPAFADLKKFKAAIIVRRGDINGLASAIVKVLEDKKARSLLINGLKKWLSSSCWSSVAKETANLYASLLL